MAEGVKLKFAQADGNGNTEIEMTCRGAYPEVPEGPLYLGNDAGFWLNIFTIPQSRMIVRPSLIQYYESVFPYSFWIPYTVRGRIGIRD